MKTISFIVPCYNSADYMDTCVKSLLDAGADIEIILVNDGSTKDDTSAKAHAWEEAYPSVVRAIDQENKGHGGALNTGISLATGMYLKVVDSDDWLDAEALQEIMIYIRLQAEKPDPCDLLIANYVYDKVDEEKQQVISYNKVFPHNREFTWDDMGRFMPSQYLLMHSVIYRTEILRSCGLILPEHCFYVDNIFVYLPLPHVKSLRYFNLDLYHYYIGREDQSVNESVMLSRIDQQIRITKYMIDALDLSKLENTQLAQYMYSYLSMMMCICSIFLRMENTVENEEKRAEIWAYLQEKRPGMYAKIRASILNLGSNLPGSAGRALGLGAYRIAQKIFKFN